MLDIFLEQEGFEMQGASMVEETIPSTNSKHNAPCVTVSSDTYFVFLSSETRQGVDYPGPVFCMRVSRNTRTSVTIGL